MGIVFDSLVNSRSLGRKVEYLFAVALVSKPI